MFSEIRDINSLAFQGGGIDYLELYLPASVRFTPKFEESRRHGKLRLNVEDLRMAGWPIILKHPVSRGKNPSGFRTLRIDRVIHKDCATILALLSEALAGVNPLDLSIRRVDFAVDLKNGPTVEHFRQATRVHLKRKGREYTTQSEAPSKMCHAWGTVQTISFGDVTSDCLKIYDKAAEQRETASGAYGPVQTDWVRIERLLVGSRIPPEIRTLGLLFENGIAYDPFCDVEIATHADVTESDILLAKQLSPSQKKDAFYVRALVREFGRAGAYKQLGVTHKRNRDRMFERFDSVLNLISPVMPSAAQLSMACQRACHMQFNGSLAQRQSTVSL